MSTPTSSYITQIPVAHVSYGVECILNWLFTSGKIIKDQQLEIINTLNQMNNQRSKIALGLDIEMDLPHLSTIPRLTRQITCNSMTEPDMHYLSDILQHMGIMTGMETNDLLKSPFISFIRAPVLTNDVIKAGYERALVSIYSNRK